MKHLKQIAILLLVFAAGCELKDKSGNGTDNASVVAFHSEKLYCYWGWEIKVGSEIIRADSIPGMNPSTDIIFPINGNITIGSKTRDCGKGASYYEIIEFVKTK